MYTHIYTVLFLQVTTVFEKVSRSGKFSSVFNYQSLRNECPLSVPEDGLAMPLVKAKSDRHLANNLAPTIPLIAL